MVVKFDKILVFKLFWFKSWDDVKRVKEKKNLYSDGFSGVYGIE